ncbi:uncharacterized protein LOC127449017 [Myxocyprinus asiaticus]|uniref:uncharacterized protein LOC127449017 n=1 Tax=Myxocyprinus asiaticus TaxID=70543 RepID=UPI0022232ACF|nr:uncharacterized protein LOC127449017 [Myxocyprinus asiaticus]XP_051568049.1 uncharacterized protein LOC127449017 [Myxocyprinus asiaticus]XP_051568051.1 uncharacterized protein LOC127449017 [Myxocyprinus asiaticus]XP_051568052.1 uncharacterized protein LOC127449017 [Myxocyprinus asiaticus]
MTQILSMKSMKMMVMMSLLYSVLADQSLECHNDFFNTFTCVWNTSKLATNPPVRTDSNCSLHVMVKKNSLDEESAKLSPDSAEPNIRSATIVFKSSIGIIIPAAFIHQDVRCENFENPVATIPQHKAIGSVVKVSPPQMAEVDGLNVSWRFGSPKSRYLTHKFELQFKSAAQSWTDVKTISELTDLQVELPEEHVILHEQYVVRVRDKPLLSNATWSEWSKEYSWTSKVGRRPTMPGVGEVVGLDWSSSIIGITLTGITLATISIFTILFKCYKITWFEKIQSSYIPDPSKYFGDLNSHHKGNFKSWLGLVFALEVDSECVSPVEVVKLQDCDNSCLTERISSGMQDRWEGTTKSSNFSNSTYFLSQSSTGPRNTLEPCSVHCSYGPAGGDSALETVLQCSTAFTHSTKDRARELESDLKKIEQLRQDTQSPDSGFAAGAEDSLEETDLPSPLGLNLLPHLLLDLHVPHPNRLLLSGWERTPLMLGTNRLIPTIELDPDLHRSCGLIEPSSGDYMPVKNVQN